MCLSQIIADNQEVIVGGCFTIIGIVIGWLLNLCQSYFTNKREDRIHIRDKREETYLMMIKTFQSLRNHYLSTKQFDIPDEIYANFEETLNLLKMYASLSIEKKYEGFLDELEKDYRHKDDNSEAYEKAMRCMNELSTMVRKELETEVV